MLSSIRTCYNDGDCQDMKGGEDSIVRKHERTVRFSEEERRARWRYVQRRQGMAASFMGALGISAWVAITRLATLKTLKRSKHVFKKAKSYSTDDGSTGTKQC